MTFTNIHFCFAAIEMKAIVKETTCKFNISLKTYFFHRYEIYIVRVQKLSKFDCFVELEIDNILKDMNTSWFPYQFLLFHNIRMNILFGIKYVTLFYM